MKAITIHQPWASLIACGAKQIETRGWYTHYRGPLAIHASKICDVEAQRRFSIVSDLTSEELPCGCVIAIANLIDCQKISGKSKLIIEGVEARKAILANGETIKGNEYSFGDYETSRYAWILRDVQPIEPIETRGRQGLWNWEGRIESE